MPTFKELQDFLINVGMPWSFSLLVLAILYRVGMRLVEVFKDISKTLDHLAQHFIGQEHIHRPEDRDGA